MIEATCPGRRSQYFSPWRPPHSRKPSVLLCRWLSTSPCAALLLLLFVPCAAQEKTKCYPLATSFQEIYNKTNNFCHMPGGRTAFPRGQPAPSCTGHCALLPVHCLLCGNSDNFAVTGCRFTVFLGPRPPSTYHLCHHLSYLAAARAHLPRRLKSTNRGCLHMNVGSSRPTTACRKIPSPSSLELTTKSI